MNKYQEALDTIKKAFKFRNMISAYQRNSFDVIQELIDNYEAHSKLCDETIAENIELEKALDYCYELLSHNPIRVGWQAQWKTKEKWKEFVDEKLSSISKD